MFPVDTEMTASAARLWLNERGRATVATDPMTVLEVIVALEATSESDDVARWLRLVGEAHDEPAADISALLYGTWAEHHLGRGQVGHALRCIRVAMGVYDGQPPNEWLLPLLYGVYTRAHISAGEIDEARAVLDQVLAHPIGRPALDEVRWPSQRAWVAFLDGDLSLAMRLGEECLRRADELRLGGNEPGRVLGALAVAGVHAERMNDAAAEASLASAAQSATVGGRAWFRCVVSLQQAAYARALGDAGAAETHLALARLMMPSPSKEVEQWFTLEAARQAVRFAPWTAAEVVDELEENATAIALRVQSALERDDQRGAEEAVALLPDPISKRETIEYGMLRALVDHGKESALANLDVALTAAAPEGYMRSIISAGTAAPKFLAAFPAGIVHRSYVDTLLDGVGVGDTACTDRYVRRR